MSTKQALPTWDLTNVYPSLDSAEFKQDMEKLAALMQEFEQYLKDNHIDPDQPLQENDPQKLAKIIAGFIEKANTIETLAISLNAYINSFIATDSYNQQAAKALSELQQMIVKLQQLGSVIFQGWLAKLADQIDEIIPLDETLEAHQFTLKETIEQSQYMMSTAEEELAGELSLSGTRAWEKLQNDITSQLKWEVENEDGEMVKLPMTAVINFRNHEDEDVRRRGYEAEMEAWKTVEVPLAAALNGMKGAQGVIYRRQGREDAVHQSLDQSRIDRETLEAMLAAMKNAQPMVRKYFKAKAKRLGKEALPWYDLFAPLGKIERTFTYPEAQKFVLENFAKFSDELAGFAQTAFDKNWIDVGPRDGKGAGAFCMGIPSVKESRVLLNFEENLDWVFTLAHELGHGFHNYCLYQADRTRLQSGTPMTLAETASIMCETIVTNATIDLAADKEEELAILETALIGDSQLLVDIYSRYLFESEIFKRREKSDLSPDEINEIMEWAQKETYGDGLDPDYLQKYMWTWKPHYYIPELSFYNYPYTFGMLFGTGLYKIYQERGSDFVQDYKDLLSSTGMGKAADLAARFNIDLRSPAFWEGSIDVVAQRVERYVNL